MIKSISQTALELICELKKLEDLLAEEIEKLKQQAMHNHKFNLIRGQKKLKDEAHRRRESILDSLFAIALSNKEGWKIAADYFRFLSENGGSEKEKKQAGQNYKIIMNKKRRQIFPDLPGLSKLSCRELLIKFYHPNESNKLAYLRQLAENYWAGEYQEKEMIAVENFLRSFITADHPLHEIHQSYLLSYGWSMYFSQQRTIRESQLIAYCFLKCSSVSAETKIAVEAIEKDQPDQQFLDDATLAIKHSKLERPAAATG